jgi:hypothetical protein
MAEAKTHRAGTKHLAAPSSTPMLLEDLGAKI